MIFFQSLQFKYDFYFIRLFCIAPFIAVIRLNWFITSFLYCSLYVQLSLNSYHSIVAIKKRIKELIPNTKAITLKGAIEDHKTPF